MRNLRDNKVLWKYYKTSNSAQEELFTDLPCALFCHMTLKRFANKQH